MDKRWSKNSMVNDVKKRRQIHRWTNTKMAKVKDGSLGLLCMMSWDDGYEAARRRFARSNANTAT